MQNQIKIFVKMNRGRSIATIVCLLAILADQFTKYLAIKKIPPSGIFLWKNDFINAKLEVLKNPFTAFGFNLPAGIIIALSVILILVLSHWLIKTLKQNLFFQSLILALIIGGALSNLVDRIFRGAVIDFLSLKIYNNFIWPHFNLADVFITLGLLSYIYFIIKKQNV